MSRRAFLKFGAVMAGALALPLGYAPRITAALAAAPRIPLVWLRGQACSGNSQAFLASTNPTVADLLVGSLSVEYDESLMAPTGSGAMDSLRNATSMYPNGYIAVVEGAIPTADEGVHCTVGGRAFTDVVAEVCAGALGTIAIGSCAFDGGAPAAAGGMTGAAGVAQVVAASRLVALPGCPVNTENLAATLVHFLTFREFPATDGRGRPLFAYGGLIHNQCERRAHFEFGEFVLSWGDEGAQKGWCLYKLGCKGPETFANCPSVKYAGGQSWSVLAGHGCVGCTMPAFWDVMGDAYGRLPAPIALAPNLTADQIGVALVGGVGALTVAHGSASYVRHKRNRALERRRASRLEPETTVVPPEAQVADEVVDAIDTSDTAPAAIEPEPQPLAADLVEPEAAEPAPEPDEAAVDLAQEESAREESAPEESAPEGERSPEAEP